MYITLLIVFFAKIISNMLDTLRTIFTQRNRAIIAAITLATSSFAYNITIRAIANADGYLVITIAALASGIGCYLAIMVTNKHFKELGVRILLSDKKETMQEFRDFMAENHITNIALDSYTRGSWDEKSITLITFPDTKEKDHLITDFVKTKKDEGTKIKIVPKQ